MWKLQEERETETQNEKEWKRSKGMITNDDIKVIFERDLFTFIHSFRSKTRKIENMEKQI